MKTKRITAVILAAALTAMQPIQAAAQYSGSVQAVTAQNLKTANAGREQVYTGGLRDSINGNIAVSSDSPGDTQSTVRLISLGDEHSSAVTENGTLYVWGNNENGYIGNGKTENVLKPEVIMKNVLSCDLNAINTAITNNGELYIWGNNSKELIANNTTEDILEPVRIMEDVTDATTGVYSIAAITKDGSLYMWGDILNYDLNNDIGEDSAAPVKMLDNVSKIYLDSGGESAAAITEDGGLYVFGANPHGTLGNGTTDSIGQFEKILDDVKDFSFGFKSGCAVTEDGSLYMWGWNCNGQIGNGTKEDVLEPVKILDNVDTACAVQYNVAAITNDGSLYMWGDNDKGQVGNGKTRDVVSPVKVMSDVSETALGYSHSAAITKDGSLFLWGNNGDGQIGNGTKDNVLSPELIMSNVSNVALGNFYSAAIKDDGSLYMWGANNKGQLGIETTENALLPVKINFTVEPDDPAEHDPEPIATFTDWQTAFKYQLHKLISDGTVIPNNLENGPKFYLYDLHSDYTPELFVSMGDAQFPTNLVYSYSYMNKTLPELTVSRVSDNFAYCREKNILRATVVTDTSILVYPYNLYYDYVNEGFAEVTEPEDADFEEINVKKYEFDDQTIDYVIDNWGKSAVTTTTAVTTTISTTTTSTTIEPVGIITGQCGDDLYYTLDEYGELYISGTGDMWDYDEDEKISPFKDYSNRILSLSMDNTVTSIGDLAFSHCTKLEDVQLSDGLTRIGKDAFLDTKIYNDQTWENKECLVKYVDKWVVGRDTNYPSEDDDAVASANYVHIKDGTIGIADYAYYGSGRPVSFALPDSLVYIGAKAFAQKDGEEHNLRSITIPKNVISIGAGAFDSEYMVSIHFENSQTQIFDDENTIFSNAVISCIEGNGENKVKQYARKYNRICYSFDDERMFKPEKDGNGFHHVKSLGGGYSGITNYKFKSSSFASAFLKNGNNTLSKIDYVRRVSAKWEGSCFGVSAVMAMKYNDIYDIFDGNFYDMPRPCKDDRIHDIINYYYLSQFSFADDQSKATKALYAQRIADHPLYNHNLSKALKDIVETLSGNKKCYMLGFSTDQDSVLLSGHCIITIGCYECDEGYCIRLFDLNNSAVKYMIISSDFQDIKLQKDDGSFCANNSIRYLRLIDPYNLYSKATDLTGSGDTWIRCNQNGKFKIANSNGEYLQNENGDFSGNISIMDLYPIAHDDIDIFTNYELNFCVENSESFHISELSDSCDVTVHADDNRAFSFVGNNIESIDFCSKNNEVVLAGDNMTYQVFITTGSTVGDDESGLVSISGEGSGSIAISAENGNVHITPSGTQKDLVLRSYVGEQVFEQEINGSSAQSFTIVSDGSIGADNEAYATTTTVTTTLTNTASTTTTTSSVLTTLTTVVSSATATTEPSAAPNFYGDVNCDGRVNNDDITALKMWLNDPENNTLTPTGKANADVYNCGDGLTVEDAATIRDWVDGVISTLPYSYYKPTASVTSTTITSSRTTLTTTNTTTVPVTTTTEAPAPIIYKLGDVNDDGSIDATDSSDILSEYVRTSTGEPRSYTEKQFLAADVNYDEIIDSTDASDVLSYYAYISTGGTMPAEEFFKRS